MNLLTPVVTACDEKFLPGLRALLNSLRHHCPGRTAYVFDCGVPLEEQYKLQSEHKDLQWQPSDAFAALPLPGVGSRATYARLQIGEVFSHHPRILYLDADTIVSADISELDELPLRASDAVAACVEPYTPNFASHNGVHDFERLGFTGREPYFNAGVMLVQPAAWKHAHVAERAIAYLRRDDVKISLFDQEALNVALAGQWRELDPTWNVSRYWLKPERRQHRPAILDSARIIHFLSADKPWIAPGAAHPWLVQKYKQFASE